MNKRWEPTAVVRILHNNTTFFTSAPCSETQKHRHRTWVVRVVHAKSSRDTFIDNMRRWFQNMKGPIRWLLVSTNKNREFTHDTQTSYVLLWFKDACREATILRNMVIAVGGLDTQLQACKPEVAQIRADLSTEEAKMILASKKALAETVRSNISYAPMASADFWQLAEEQIVENKKYEFNKRCDLVMGYPRKVKFVKKRKNKSLEATVELCKQQKLKKIHRPEDVKEQASLKARHQFMMANLPNGSIIYIQYNKNRRRKAIIVEKIIQNYELYYNVEYLDDDCDEDFQTIHCRSETLIDVELSSKQYIGVTGLVLESR